MERIKHTIVSAVKNVWYNKKRYVYFVILLIFIQSLISCVFLLNHNNNRNELRYLENQFQVTVGETEYPYHIVINNMTDDQRADLLYYYNSLQDIRKFFHPLAVETVSSGNYIRYNMYIYFSAKDDPNASSYQLYQRFRGLSVFQESLSEGVSITETPYLLASRSAVVNTSLSTLLCVLITAIGTVTFGILFNTVVNHFKFSYGVYMTFGANFKKLLSAALSEMLFLNLITFIPGFLVSILITYILTSSAGYGISVQIYPMFISLLCSVILTVVSVTFVMKKLSLSTPDRLIRSVNNVGLITSPRFSKRIPDRGFPVQSELLSLVRFRKYIISLVLTTLIFAGAFCGGAFLMEVQAQKEAVRMPQFTLSFPTNGLIHGEVITTSEETKNPSPEGEEEELPPLEYAPGYTYTEDVRETLYAIEGVDYIVKNRSLEASHMKSHILIPSKRLTLQGRINGAGAGNGYSGFCNVDYTLFDEEVADNLLFFGATITGDIDSVINGTHTVAISDSINNTRMIKLKVGDTIKIAVSYKQKRVLPKDPASSYKEMMETYLNCYYFEYIELTVGAIVSDLPVGDTFPLYMNADTFSEITKTKAYFANVDIYCKEGISESDVRSVQTRLYTLQQYYKMAITNTHQESTRAATELKNYPGVILYVSVLLLVISVLITVLSQSLFYQMRKQELDIYLCLGADFSHIRKLFLVDAAFFSALSALFYGIFAMIANLIIYKLANVNLGGALIRYGFDVPLWAVAIGLGTVVLSSFFTVMGAYWSYKKHAAPVFTGKAVASVTDTSSDNSRNELFDSDAR